MGVGVLWHLWGIRECRGVRGVLEGWQECRYSGARRGIEGIRGYWGLLGGIGGLKGYYGTLGDVRGNQGV